MSKPLDQRGPGRGKLWVVATPLGHPADLSPRAREVLAAADVLLAEDTRSARRLLADAGIAAREPGTIVSCFDGNESDRAGEVVGWIEAGRTVALVSEAGTPLVSDPGFRVVAAVIAAGMRVEPVPGPSALLAALVVSGLSPDRFTFIGFPPRKSGPRRRLFEGLRAHPFTLVLYESPLRTGETLDDLAATLGPARRACLARELTKPHEEVVRDTLAGLAERYRHDRPLGEVTLVVQGAATGDEEQELDPARVTEAAHVLLETGLSARDAATELAERFGRPRREIYALVTAAAAERQR